MKNSKQKQRPLAAALLGASVFFSTGGGVAYALPASLDSYTGLASDNFTLKGKSGEIYSQTADVPVDFEDYTSALKGDREDAENLHKALKKKIAIGDAKIETRSNGRAVYYHLKRCHYTMPLVKRVKTKEGLVSTYQFKKDLPKNCGNEDVPNLAVEKVMLKARLINSAKGVYQLPIQPDGSAVSAVLSTLAPTSGNDAGLFGYTYFIKYADGHSVNWGTAGIISNKLALGKSHDTVSYLIAEAVGQGALRLSRSDIHLGSPSLEAPTLRVSTGEKCAYQMFLDKSSIHHKDTALSLSFQAPKLAEACLKEKNPLSVTMTIEPLNIDPDGTNRMIVEKIDKK